MTSLRKLLEVLPRQRKRLVAVAHALVGGGLHEDERVVLVVGAAGERGGVVSAHELAERDEPPHLRQSRVAGIKLLVSLQQRGAFAVLRLAVAVHRGEVERVLRERGVLAIDDLHQLREPAAARRGVGALQRGRGVVERGVGGETPLRVELAAAFVERGVVGHFREVEERLGAERRIGVVAVEHPQLLATLLALADERAHEPHAVGEPMGGELGEECVGIGADGLRVLHPLGRRREPVEDVSLVDPLLALERQVLAPRGRIVAAVEEPVGHGEPVRRRHRERRQHRRKDYGGKSHFAYYTIFARPP